jgi:predicted transglutaminase-like cysteine proteinase
MRRFLAASIGILLVVAQPAGAVPVEEAARGEAPRPALPHSIAMPADIPVPALPGAIGFCHAYPQACGNRGGAERVALTEQVWAELDAVNRAVNAAIRPERETGPDRWRLDTMAGDCDDYAVQKRQALIERGYPAGAIALAMARLPHGEMHLVAVFRSDRGDFVLDNRSNEIRAWTSLPYRFQMMTAGADPRRWVAVAPAGRAAPAMLARLAPPVRIEPVRPEAAAKPETRPVGWQEPGWRDVVIAALLF